MGAGWSAEIDDLGGNGSLSRRPRHGPAAKQMDVQMGNCLPTVFSIVDDQPESFVLLIHAEVRCDLSGSEKEMPEQVAVSAFGFTDAGKGLLRDDENMRRCLGGNVVKGEAKLVFMDDVRGNFPGNDLLKQSHVRTRSASPLPEVPDQ